MSNETSPKPKSEVRARVIAAVALAALTAAVGGVGNVAYRAATDSFVAPVVLTPASEPVVAGRLKLDELKVDRTRAKADLEEIDAEIAALERTIDKLDELRRRASDGLEWTVSTSNRQIAAGVAEQRSLAQQHKLLTSLVERQTAQVEATRANATSDSRTPTSNARFTSPSTSTIGPTGGSFGRARWSQNRSL